MAERSNFKAVMLFTTFNVLIYALPAHWMWSETGWLRSLGARDIAGAGMVHMLGGFSGLIGAYFVGNIFRFGEGWVWYQDWRFRVQNPETSK